MQRTGLFSITGAAASLLLLCSPLPAQQWNIDAQAGRIRSALDPNAQASQSIVLGLRYDDPLTGFRVSGGVPTTSQDPLWAAIAGARRVVARSNDFYAGFDLAGNGFLLHDRVSRTQTIPGSGGLFGSTPPTVQQLPSLSGTAIAGQAMPIVGYDGHALQAYVRGGVSYYSSDFANQQRTRTVQLAEAQLNVAASSNFALMPVVRYYHAKEGHYTYAGATGVLAQGPLSLYATVGQWLNDSTNATPWSAGAALRVHERATLNAGIRSDGIDPLYQQPPVTSWNVGVSILVGGKTARAVAPVPARYEAGRAVIELPLSQSATQPSVAGDFNNWKPAPMQRAGSKWMLALPLKPGVYNFSFVNEKGEWFVPSKYPGRKDDGMGGQVAVLVVNQ